MYVKLGPYTNDDTDREVVIHINEYDSWNVDHTLALIALPLIKQLKETQHGAPFVENVDVPVYLRCPSSFDRSNGDVDEKHYARWDYVLDEIIHALETIVDDSWDDQFFYDDESNPSGFGFHKEAYAEAHERRQKGFELFGKYFQSLWD